MSLYGVWIAYSVITVSMNYLTVMIHHDNIINKYIFTELSLSVVYEKTSLIRPSVIKVNDHLYGSPQMLFSSKLYPFITISEITGENT